jgi:F-type H+-transporting ATPase subunit a
MDVTHNNCTNKPAKPGSIIQWFSFIFLLIIIPGYLLSAPVAEPAHLGQEPAEFDASKVIIDHVLDSYDWHIADFRGLHISIPLPVILSYKGNWYFFMSSRFKHGTSSYKGFAIATESPGRGRVIRVLDDGITRDNGAGFIIDLSITKNVVAIFVTSFLICLIFIRIARRYRRKGSMAMPGGLPSLLEPVILFVRDQIALPAIGPKKHRKFVPYLLSLFFFIFFNNLMGLVPFFPGGANVTGNISVTMTLAMFTFFAIIVFANKGYWEHIFNTPGVPLWLKLPIPLMPVIELTGVFIKPFVLMVRLFANIAAGHIIILGFASLIFVLGSVSVRMGFAITPLSLIFLIFMNFLELLVAFLQAYVFTMFSAIFLGLAVPEKH